MSWSVVFTSTVVAAFVSGLVTLIVPWSAWGVEKRREARQHQRDLIKSWRAGLAAWDADQKGGVHTRPASFIKTDWYLTLRTYLKDSERMAFEGMDEGSTLYLVTPAPLWHHFTPLVAAAIDRVEAEWRLDNK